MKLVVLLRVMARPLSVYFFHALCITYFSPVTTIADGGEEEGGQDIVKLLEVDIQRGSTH